MEISAVRWTSLVDFPDRVAAIVWTIGCNLRCPFCYNAELVLPEQALSLPRIPCARIFAGLSARRGFLDGVAVTGGEPTLQADLLPFLEEIKARGLAVKLDTNGTRPQVLAKALTAGLVDYVAVDVKAPFARYGEFTSLLPPRPAASELVSDDRVASELVSDGSSESNLVADVTERVQASMALVRERAPDYEFRITVAPGLDEHALAAVAARVSGARRLVLQPFVAPEEKQLLDEELRGRPALTGDELRTIARRLSSLVPTTVRA